MSKHVFIPILFVSVCILLHMRRKPPSSLGKGPLTLLPTAELAEVFYHHTLLDDTLDPGTLSVSVFKDILTKLRVQDSVIEVFLSDFPLLKVSFEEFARTIARATLTNVGVDSDVFLQLPRFACKSMVEHMSSSEVHTVFET